MSQAFLGPAPDGTVQGFGLWPSLIDSSNIKRLSEEIKPERKSVTHASRKENGKAEMELKVLTSCSLSASPRAGEGER